MLKLLNKHFSIGYAVLEVLNLEENPKDWEELIGGPWEYLYVHKRTYIVVHKDGRLTCDKEEVKLNLGERLSLKRKYRRVRRKLTKYMKNTRLEAATNARKDVLRRLGETDEMIELLE